MSIYFAYGSNMSSARLLARVSGAERLDRAFVNDWQLAFNKPGRDGSGKANLVPASGVVTWGVAWTLPEDPWPLLDGFEPGYERAVFRLLRTDGREVHAHVYLHECPADAPSIPPSNEYLDHLVAGAIEHDLPEDYVANLRSFRGTS